MNVFEETYGFFLTRDVFADRLSISNLPRYGFPRGERVKEAVLVNTRWNSLQDTVQWLKADKVLAMILVPCWKSHVWYKNLEERATHRLSIPVGVVFDAEQGNGVPCTEKMECLFVDYRYEESIRKDNTADNTYT